MLDQRGRHLAVRATYDGAPGHPVLLERRLLDHVGELRGDTGARDLLVGDHVRAWECGRLCDPTDIDTPERLRRPIVKLEQSFEVAAPIDEVWAALNDLERVAPCLPGRGDHRARRGRHLPRHLPGQARPDHRGLPRHDPDRQRR